MKSLEQRRAITGTCVFLLYFVLNYLAELPLKLVGVNIADLSLFGRQMYLLSYNLFIMILFLFIYRKDIKVEFDDFKHNYKRYFKENIKYWLIALAVMYASNMIIAFLKYQFTGTITSADNEELIRETLSQAPIYTFISAALCAPIIEELTFRKSLRKVFYNNTLFIVASSIIFGSLHVVTDNLNWINILYLIPYCAPGVAFAYILVKTDNIFNTISLHLFHNTILMIIELLMITRGLL